ncbi:efflux RND transporter periplasmic adaptor subunit [Xanthomonas sacchari]|uniref:efflux RND transporter periplasmic adaptor subunit n=1 Tax=Xanthomonas sacchari TaxID=56458 RepID=UPI00224EFED8|nr:efflux RND transporter periplasmic adaptor subunit [Xanthomonas sacchari]UYK83468.1 efflux RND transporter periplasmic adaptor subunit [Xanthomonas sacchari]
MSTAAPTRPADPSPRHAMPRRRWPFVAAAVLVALLLAVWLRPRHAPTKATPPVPVTSAPVLRKDVPIRQTGIGTVLPIASVTVHSRIDGQLIDVGFSEGQDVKAGQVLARLDPRTDQAQLAAATAQLAKDKAQLGNAQADLQRYTQLLQDNATTRQTLDTQKALVTQLRATLQSDAAAIDNARVQLDFTTIRAPIDGRAGARLVDPGNIVHASDAGGLVVLNQIDPIAVQFTLPESAFQQINRALQAAPASVGVDAVEHGSGQALAHGTLALLNNQIDTSTGTIAMKAHFPNSGHTLWPGQTVDARITLGMRSGALVVPSAAVQRSQDGEFVYVVGSDGSVRDQPVQVLDEADGESVIGQGVQAGQRVVVDGQYRLHPGAKVVEAKPARHAKPAAAGAHA